LCTKAGIRGYLRYHTIFYTKGMGIMKPYEGVTLTYVGDDWICGDLKLDNGKNSLSGKFAALKSDPNRLSPRLHQQPASPEERFW